MSELQELRLLLARLSVAWEHHERGAALTATLFEMQGIADEGQALAARETKKREREPCAEGCPGYLFDEQLQACHDCGRFTDASGVVDDDAAAAAFVRDLEREVPAAQAIARQMLMEDGDAVAVAVGTAFSGLELVGPFSSTEDAVAWAERWGGDECHVVSLEAPEIAPEGEKSIGRIVAKMRKAGEGMPDSLIPKKTGACPECGSACWMDHPDEDGRQVCKSCGYGL